MTGAGIRLRINRLVLEGVAPRDRAALVRAFEAELGRLLAAGPAPARAQALPGVSAAAAAPDDAAAAGRSAAASVARAILGGGRP